ncbi:MAG: hypothetical protein OES38_23320, partial [Gammaproteobacteria bacterium]|nr:hypothetical protein [Gammaproteobacteria bacterium]
MSASTRATLGPYGWPIKLLVLVGLSLSGSAHALRVTDAFHDVADEFEYLVDTSGTLSLVQILADPSQYRFVAAGDTHPPPGDDPVWLRLKLKFTESTRHSRYELYSLVQNIYDLRIYRPAPDGGYRESVSGNDYPAGQRELQSAFY